MLLSSFNFSFESLIPVMVLIGIASIIPIVLLGFRRPLVPIFIGELLVGIILGLHPEVREFFWTPITQSLYTISLAMLLFLSGFDTDFTVFSKKPGEFPILKWALRGLGIVYLLSFVMAFCFKKYIEDGMFWQGVVLMMLLLASTFESYINPIIHSRTEIGLRITRLSGTYATLAEFLSIIGLSVYMMIFQKNHRLWVVGIILAVLLLVFLILKKINRSMFDGIRGGYLQIGLRLSLFVFLLLVILSEYAGIEIIFGAFMFGMVIKYAQVSHREIAKIESFGAGFFIPLFFLLLGLQVPLVQVFSSWQGVYLTGIILLVILVVKLPLLYLAKWYSLSTTVIAYLLSTSTLIVSLALQHFDVFTHPFSEALVVASAITCIVPVILFYHNHSFGKKRELNQISTNTN
jgi:CPA2 family monovalent cation:H+ antiporter-2